MPRGKKRSRLSDPHDRRKKKRAVHVLQPDIELNEDIGNLDIMETVQMNDSNLYSMDELLQNGQTSFGSESNLSMPGTSRDSDIFLTLPGAVRLNSAADFEKPSSSQQADYMDQLSHFESILGASSASMASGIVQLYDDRNTAATANEDLIHGVSSSTIQLSGPGEGNSEVVHAATEQAMGFNHQVHPARQVRRQLTATRVIDPNIESDQSETEVSLRLAPGTSSAFDLGVETEISDDEDDDHIEDNVPTAIYCPARDFANVSVPGSDIGKMNVKCIDCGALHFRGEVKSKCNAGVNRGKFTQCCMKGQVKLPQLKTPPSAFRSLLENNHVLSTHFKENIRKYNSSLAFASMVAPREPMTRGPYSFVVHGQVYHNSGCLANDNIEESSYAQLYVLDSDYATELRMRRNQMVLNGDLLKELTQTIFNINVMAKSYNMMQSVVDQHRDSEAEVFMVFDESRNRGSRRHNAAAANQIAAVFTSEDGEVPSNRALIVRPKGRQLRRISILSPFIDPMVYPVLFPHGDQGWSTGLKLQNGKRMTHLQYYAYRLGYRKCSYIHLGGKLFQQFAVDAYCKIEENRLNFIKQNQKQLRAESYKGLMDHLANQAQEDELALGRRIILPSSFNGGPRSMAQHYQDAMSMVAKLGSPDLFLTFTCNPQWTEILDALLPGQKPCDRPDLIARVFKMKLSDLEDDLFKKNILGRIIGHVGVIEFQKRGLPHVHLLLTIHPDDKIRSRRQLDDTICAEIPEDNPVLREKVLKHMIHGPCGDLNPNCPCMNGDKCSHEYPKPYSTDSRLKKNGYPVYRRRDGQRVTLAQFTIGNEWVVPYNKYLLERYDAHINVELCASVKSVKYLHKYIYKGHDAASLRLSRDGESLDYDEVQRFIEARFVSSHEAFWRIFRYQMHFKSHTIQRLAVHLENEQSVVFEDGAEEEAAARASDRFTTLTGFFALNANWENSPREPLKKEDPRQYRYMDIPDHFTFKPECGWKFRKRKANEIGRMYFVSPNDTERFHMRLLLLHRKGVTSFADLRTINGISFRTYKEACLAMALITPDTELDDTLDETARLYYPHTVRQVFADIMVGCTPVNPTELWDKFKSSMTDDFIRSGMTNGQAEVAAYNEIKLIVVKHRIDLGNLIVPPPAVPIFIAGTDDSTQQSSESDDSGVTMLETLNAEQKIAADGIIASLDNPTLPRAFFVDGPGGSGKTYLYKALHRIFTTRGKEVMNVAWSGIAAQLLFEGRTAHSAFSLPVPLTKENFMPTMKVNSQQAKILRQTDVIVWDEISMAPRYAIEGVNLLLQDIMKSEQLFGGKLVLFGGDFRQIPPIVKEKHHSAVIEASLKRSFLWNKLIKHRLTINMRAMDGDAWFRQFLLDIGDGRIKKNANGMIDIPDRLRSSGDLIKETYGDDMSVLSLRDISKRAILSVKNIDCDEMNDKIMEKFIAEMKMYYSQDEAISDELVDESCYPIEFLHSLTPSGMPPHELKLKIGVVVMLLRNLNVKKGLCNGTRLIVKQLNNYTIECEAIESGEMVVLPRISMSPCDSNLPFTLKRRQFPIRLCFALTINKSQGQSFEKVGLYLPSQPFSHGQLYVAVSRCKSAQGLRILSDGDQARNVVLPELLKI